MPKVLKWKVSYGSTQLMRASKSSTNPQNILKRNFAWIFINIFHWKMFWLKRNQNSQHVFGCHRHEWNELNTSISLFVMQWFVMLLVVLPRDQLTATRIRHSLLIAIQPYSAGSMMLFYGPLKTALKGLLVQDLCQDLETWYPKLANFKFQLSYFSREITVCSLENQKSSGIIIHT